MLNGNQDLDPPTRRGPPRDALLARHRRRGTEDYRDLSMFLAEKDAGTDEAPWRTPAFPAARSRC